MIGLGSDKNTNSYKMKIILIIFWASMLCSNLTVESINFSCKSQRELEKAYWRFFLQFLSALVGWREERGYKGFDESSKSSHTSQPTNMFSININVNTKYQNIKIPSFPLPQSTSFRPRWHGQW